MRSIFLLLFSVIISSLQANDGAYYASGNQLIPMIETRIEVRKEILDIRRVKDQLYVDVYYEFFNPDADKSLDVGFEAPSPSGDVDPRPMNRTHPFIHDFTVIMNGGQLPHKVSIVGDSIYYKNGKFIQKSDKEITEAIGDNWADFKYAYHFRATFKKGLNIIRHTYRFKLSNSVDLYYNFEYILSAAKRWKNKGIDDFTLKIDMGELAEFSIGQRFYNNNADWKIEGSGKKKDIGVDKDIWGIDSLSKFFIQKGQIVFQKNNFRPKGELVLFSQRFIPMDDTFNYKTMELPFTHGDRLFVLARDEFSLKILKNLPYARRGYIFKNPELQAYFEKQEWYIPDPGYVAELAGLSSEEKLWLNSLVLLE